MEYLPFERDRRRRSRSEAPIFDDPVYLDEEDIQAFEKEAARVRRRLTSRRRRQIKKASKQRRYAVDQCVIRADWVENRFAPFVVTRKQPGGSVALASGIVDLGCLGLKDSMFEPDVSPTMAEEVMYSIGATGQQADRCAPGVAAKMLVHGVAYAHRLGFEIPREYFPLRALLGVPSNKFPETPVPLGHRKKPVFMPGAYDDSQAILGHLEDRLGPNGFYYFAPADPSRRRP